MKLTDRTYARMDPNIKWDRFSKKEIANSQKYHFVRLENIPNLGHLLCRSHLTSLTPIGRAYSSMDANLEFGRFSEEKIATSWKKHCPQWKPHSCYSDSAWEHASVLWEILCQSQNEWASPIRIAVPCSESESIRSKLAEIGIIWHYTTKVHSGWVYDMFLDLTHSEYSSKYQTLFNELCRIYKEEAVLMEPSIRMQRIAQTIFSHSADPCAALEVLSKEIKYLRRLRGEASMICSIS